MPRSIPGTCCLHRNGVPAMCLIWLPLSRQHASAHPHQRRAHPGPQQRWCDAIKMGRSWADTFYGHGDIMGKKGLEGLSRRASSIGGPAVPAPTARPLFYFSLPPPAQHPCLHAYGGQWSEQRLLTSLTPRPPDLSGKSSPSTFRARSTPQQPSTTKPATASTHADTPAVTTDHQPCSCNFL